MLGRRWQAQSAALPAVDPALVIDEHQLLVELTAVSDRDHIETAIRRIAQETDTLDREPQRDRAGPDFAESSPVHGEKAQAVVGDVGRDDQRRGPASEVKAVTDIETGGLPRRRCAQTLTGQVIDLQTPQSGRADDAAGGGLAGVRHQHRLVDLTQGGGRRRHHRSNRGWLGRGDRPGCRRGRGAGRKAANRSR